MAQPSVCARVGVQLEQEAVITRNAFRATLTLNNGGDEPLSGIGVVLDIRDAEGNPANSRFGIFPPVVSGMSAVDGSGVLAPGLSGTASWIIVPTDEAAPTEPLVYGFGGTLSYITSGGTVTIPFVPEHLSVLPNPSLGVKYFWERDVFSDDPFTPEVEPAQPFSVGLMMSNTGYGTAHNVRVSSAQPRITDNERGLVIAFQLIGTQVGSQAISPALNVNLGNIEPGGVAVARWLMTSSLQGRFVSYEASYEHLDGLGDERLSLIDSLDIYELVHVVRTQEEGDDLIPDFLTNETTKGEVPSDPDRRGLPDTLHLSDGTVERNIGVDLEPEVSVHGFTVTVTASSSKSGWTYIRLPDPFHGAYRIVRAERADGRVLPLGFNVWQTDRTFRPGQTPLRLHRAHLFDKIPGGGQATYTLTFEPDTVAPSVTAWRVSTRHGEDLPFVALPAHLQPEYSEARERGPRSLLVEFSEPIASGTFTPANVEITGIGIGGESIDLAALGVSWTTLLSAGGTSGRISLAGTLPNAARYCVALVGVEDLQGNPLEDNNRLLFTVLAGDVTGDRRVNNTDVGAVLALLGTQAIDPGNPQHVRADVNRDGRIDQQDADLVIAMRRLDCRFIPSPCFRGGRWIDGDEGGSIPPDNGFGAVAQLGDAERPDSGQERSRDGGPEGALHYRFGDQVRPLPIDPTRLAIHSLLPDQDAADVLINSRVPVAAAPAPYPGWWIVDLPSHLERPEATEALVLRLSDAGLYISPVLIGEDGGPMWIPSSLLMRLAEAGGDPHTLLEEAAPGSELLEADMAGVDRLLLVDTRRKHGWDVLSLANTLADDERFEFAEPDMIFSGRNASLRHRRIAARRFGQASEPPAGPRIAVAVLDDGIDAEHALLTSVRGRDFTFQGPGSGVPRTELDAHGTSLAGCVVFEREPNDGRLSEIAPHARLLSARVLVATSPEGAWISQASWTVRALAWARDEGARVTLNSNRFGFASNAVASMYRQTRSEDLVHISMAGNEPGRPIGFPASLAEVLAVGSADASGQVSAFNSPGKIDLFALGEHIITTDRRGAAGYVEGDFVEISGTSFAAALTAGAAAMLLAADPSLTPERLEEALRLSCASITAGSAGVPGRKELQAVNAIKPVKRLRGDLTGDGVVTNADVVEFVRLFLAAEPDGPADLNGDGRVDFADLQLLLELLGGSR